MSNVNSIWLFATLIKLCHCSGCLPIFEEQIQGYLGHFYKFLAIFQGWNYFFKVYIYNIQYQNYQTNL